VIQVRRSWILGLKRWKELVPPDKRKKIRLSVIKSVVANLTVVKILKLPVMHQPTYRTLIKEMDMVSEEEFYE